MLMTWATRHLAHDMADLRIRHAEQVLHSTPDVELWQQTREFIAYRRYVLTRQLHAGVQPHALPRQDA